MFIRSAKERKVRIWKDYVAPTANMDQKDRQFVAKVRRPCRPAYYTASGGLGLGLHSNPKGHPLPLCPCSLPYMNLEASDGRGKRRCFLNGTQSVQSMRLTLLWLLGDVSLATSMAVLTAVFPQLFVIALHQKQDQCLRALTNYVPPPPPTKTSQHRGTKRKRFSSNLEHSLPGQMTAESPAVSPKFPERSSSAQRHGTGY